MIRPTEAVAVVRPRGEAAELSLMRWGFAPPAPKRPPVINFRSEGRSFGGEGRALILASHFFEYTGAKSPKTRWRFTKVGVADGGGAEDPFAIAGWTRAAPEGPNPPLTSAGEPWPPSVTMLTCDPGPDVSPIHDRQIVILDRGELAHLAVRRGCGRPGRSSCPRLRERSASRGTVDAPPRHRGRAGVGWAPCPAGSPQP